jgi:hypothetical protein
MHGDSAVISDGRSSYDSRDAERRLAQALRGLGATSHTTPSKVVEEGVCSRELLQLAWDRAVQEIDELRAELRRLRQRHQEAERQLLARIGQRKRLPYAGRACRAGVIRWLRATVVNHAGLVAGGLRTVLPEKQRRPWMAVTAQEGSRGAGR